MTKSESFNNEKIFWERVNPKKKISEEKEVFIRH